MKPHTYPLREKIGARKVKEEGRRESESNSQDCSSLLKHLKFAF